jgi:KUP system potassium uptake protein
VTVEGLGELLASPKVQRVLGLCFFYSNIQDGLTPVVGHYIKNMSSLHTVTVFVTLRYLLVAKIAQRDRIQITRLGHNGVCGCTIQYGYADNLGLDNDGDDLAAQVTNNLRWHIQTTTGRYSTEAELAAVEAARIVSEVHVRGKLRLYVGKEAGWFDRILLGSYDRILLHAPARHLPVRPAGARHAATTARRDRHSVQGRLTMTRARLIHEKEVLYSTIFT